MQLGIVPALGEGALEEPSALVDGGDPFAHQAAGPDSGCTGGKRLELGDEQALDAFELAGDDEVLRERDHARGALRSVRRREAERVLAEDDGFRRRAAIRRTRRGCRDRGSEFLVRPLRRECEVAGAELAVGREQVRELEVQLAALAGRRALERGRREQRMRRARPVVVDDDQPLGDRGVERARIAQALRAAAPAARR